MKSSTDPPKNARKGRAEMGGDGELSLYYLGTAQVRLQNLRYSSSITVSDECTGCCFSDLEHNLPVLITASEYRESLASSNVFEHSLYHIGPPPKLSLPSRLELPCLHGRFRLELARKQESSSLDDWWSVDLYKSDTPKATTDRLRQYYNQHSPLGDGEKYLYIRYYEREKNVPEAMRWRKLVGTQMKNLNQILRNEWLCEALHKLEPYRSLWTNFQISSFPHILSWRCSQEIEHYLIRMQQIWHEITDGNEFWCDRNTIEKLGGLAPKWSSRDRAIVEAFFDTGQVFCRVIDPVIRAQILKRILTVDGFLLTFRTFFKHVKVLGPIMLRLRELFPTSDLFPPRDLSEPVRRRPISTKEILLQKCYNNASLQANQCLLQYSDLDERHIETPDSAVYSYWQLCLSLVRHEQGTWTSSKQGKGKQVELVHPEWMIRLGQLARKLGFESERISVLCCNDADMSQIHQHMRQERPSSYYSVSLEEFDTEARSRQEGQRIFKRRQASPSPLMTTDSDTSNVAPKTHKELFLPTIWSALAQEARYALTDFGKLLLILTSFFGDFGSSQASPDRDVLTPEASPSNPRIFNHDIGQGVADSTLRASSIYTSPDAEPQAQEIASSASVTYSIPAYPESINQPSPLPSFEHIDFWYLSSSRHIQPTLRYTCKASKDEIMQVVSKIQSNGIAPSFSMVDRADRLKLCPSWEIHRRLKLSNRPQNVYYVYGIENLHIWITKELAIPH